MAVMSLSGGNVLQGQIQFCTPKQMLPWTPQTTHPDSPWDGGNTGGEAPPPPHTLDNLKSTQGFIMPFINKNIIELQQVAINQN